MTSSRREVRRLQAPNRRMSVMELSVTVCVVLGLLFVSYRVIGVPGRPDGAVPVPLVAHAAL